MWEWRVEMVRGALTQDTTAPMVAGYIGGTAYET